MWSTLQNHLWVLVASGVLAWLLSIALTPLCGYISRRLSLFDTRDSFRKLHRDCIPRTGGTAVVASYFLAILFSFLAIPQFRNTMDLILSTHKFILLGVLVIFLVGLLDDLVGLTPTHKLCGQLVASTLACVQWLSFHKFEASSIGSWVYPALIVGWMVVSTNAVNLIDGLDGLASGVGFFATLAVAIGALRDHNAILLLAAVPLAGTLLGFLRYNFSPASIFLGDCGSLSIGFLLGYFGVMWAESATTLAGLTAPMMALALPLTETGVTILRRALRNRPIFGGDRDHIHHRLLAQCNSVERTTLVLYAVCALGAIFSLAQQALHQQYGELIFLAFVVLLIAAIRLLDYNEFSILQRLVVKGSIFRLIDDQIHLHSLQNQLRSSASLPDAIEIIRPVCKTFGFTDIVVTSYGSALQVKEKGSYEFTVPIEGDRILVLRGSRDGARPYFALDQLIRILSTCADHPVKSNESATRENSSSTQRLMNELKTASTESAS